MTEIRILGDDFVNGEPIDEIIMLIPEDAPETTEQQPELIRTAMERYKEAGQNS